MRGYLFIVSTIVFAFSGAMAADAEKLPEAAGLLDKWKNAIYSDHEISQIELKLQGNDGSERARTAKIWYLDGGAEAPTKILMRFNLPKEMRGVSFLSHRKSGGGADQWLYFPVHKKPRRLSSHSRDEAFLDSEFTTGDISFEYEKCFEFKTKALTKLEGEPVYELEGLPRPDSGLSCPYSREKIFVRKKDGLAVKVEFYDLQQKLLKELKIDQWKKYSNRWTADFISIENVQTKNKSSIRFVSRDTDARPTEQLFSLAALEEGK